MQVEEISANFERQGDGWYATAIEIPWIAARGETLKEARENLFQAVREALANDGEVEVAEPFAFLN